MNIVFLDAQTLGKGIDFSGIEKLGTLKTYELTSPAQTIERVRDAEIVITNKVIFGEQELAACPKLKLICVAATGYNNIDLAAAAKHGVAVTNVKGYSTESVAELVIAGILAFSTSIQHYHTDTQAGKWQKSASFTMINHPFHELKGKNLGIFGYGSIGKRVAELGEAFGMNVFAVRRNFVSQRNGKRIDKQTVLRESDYISLHTPLTENTRNLFDAPELKLMKKNAVLINMARGGVVNEQALADALNQDRIRGAVVDVLTQEPPTNGNPLLGAKNIIITPHVAWTSDESRAELMKGIVQNIQLYTEGRIDEVKLCANH